MTLNNKISMTSVVTGATGFVGSHLVDMLLEKGHKVKCITRKTSSLKWLQGKDVEIIDCGLFDKESLKGVLKDADYLFHVAGVVKSKKKEGYYKGNVETTRNLLEVLVEVNPSIKKVVIVSSQTAAGPSKPGTLKNENDPCEPITTYGKSKVEQEALVKTFMDKLPLNVVRPPAVYGERDTEIFIMFKTFKQGLMTFTGFDKKKVSLAHVLDVVQCVYLAGVNEEHKGEIYFCGPQEVYTWDQIADEFQKALNKKALRIHIPHSIVYCVAGVAEFFAMFSSKAATFNLEKARDFVQPEWTCDVSKAVKQLGYKPNISLEEGVKRTADWYKDNKWL